MARHLRKGAQARKARQLRAALNRVLRGINVAAFLTEAEKYGFYKAA